MKKFIYILLCLSLFLTGCSGNRKSSAVTAVTTGLSFTAEISISNTTFSYFVEIAKSGSVSMKSATDNETCVDYLFENGKIIYKYNELEYIADISSLPESNFADFIPSVFGRLKHISDNVTYKNNQYCITDKTGKYEFTVYLGQTGLPIKITDKKNSIVTIIKNPTLIS
ncbi:MAG: hypothetical protein J6J30_01415 [Clostridia bacterium]|nr:hypothetical protein [Oscillospiraceae bacterium]MBP3599719.1 hypothetical protein [Clostridia bacterium]